MTARHTISALPALLSLNSRPPQHNSEHGCGTPRKSLHRITAGHPILSTCSRLKIQNFVLESFILGREVWAAPATGTTDRRASTRSHIPPRRGLLSPTSNFQVKLLHKGLEGLGIVLGSQSPTMEMVPRGGQSLRARLQLASLGSNPCWPSSDSTWGSCSLSGPLPSR